MGYSPSSSLPRPVFFFVSQETNPDALQTLASLRISQQRGEEALAALKKSYALWNPEAPEGDDGDDAMQQDDDEALPLYGTRLAAAKMFVELGDTEDALEIVEGLVLENEDDPECYYLCGVCNTDAAEKKQYFEMALRKIAKLEQQGQGDLDALKRVVMEQMKK